MSRRKPSPAERRPSRFGSTYLGEVLAGYQSAHPLRAGWQDRVGLHQLYPLLAHVVLFGGSYAGQVAAVVARLFAVS